MVKTENIEKAYETAKARYAELGGVDTDKALAQLKNIKLSIHCWQGGDDIHGFLNPNQELTGGELGGSAETIRGGLLGLQMN